MGQLNLVELRIQFDRLEVILPVGARYLERRRTTPRAVAETGVTRPSSRDSAGAPDGAATGRT